MVRASILGSFLAAGVALGGMADALAQPACPDLPPPAGPVIDVGPGDADALRTIVASAGSGTTIRLADGLYAMDGGDAAHRLSFWTDGVTLRSASGVPGAVVLDGAYATNELVEIRASDVTISAITLTRAYHHPIHVSGSSGRPVEGTRIHRVRVIDPGEQAIKINPVGGDGYADRGTIECSAVELTDAGRGEIRNGCYTGGIDAHQAWGWTVRRNRISGFWCPSGLSEHGMHFWQSSRDTLVEQNVIVDCARGIGFGLGSSGTVRSYPDDPYPAIPFLGHIDGIIRNNFVAAADERLFDSAAGFDTGISVEQARTPLLLHNSVVSTEAPRSSSVEWRFGNTDVGLANVLASHRLLARDGATATVATSVDDAPLSWFVDAASGDLHLTGAAAEAIDAGSALPAGLADDDLDGHSRDGAPDVGADEAATAIFVDGFENGDPGAWSSVLSG